MTSADGHIYAESWAVRGEGTYRLLIDESPQMEAKVRIGLLHTPPQTPPGVAAEVVAGFSVPRQKWNELMATMAAHKEEK